MIQHPVSAPPSLPSSQEYALLIEPRLAKAGLPVTGVLATALALALRSGGRPSLHQVVLKQGNPQQLRVRVAQVLLPWMKQTAQLVLCQE